MEIVQVTGFYPPHLGGEAQVAQRLASMQAEQHDVTVYTSGLGRGAAPTRYRYGRLRVYRDWALPVGATPVIPRLPFRLLRHRPLPDIVHVHAGLALTPELVRLATAPRHVPYVAHLHLVVRPSSAIGRVLLPLYQRSLYARFLRGAAKVICLTRAMRDEVIAGYGVPKDRVAVIPNGVDVDVFRPAIPGERRDRELLMVGPLTAQKNVLLAVAAMAELPPDVTLRIVGTGEQRDQIAARISALGLSNVRLEGRLAPPELAASYRRATAVVMPSTHEGLPLVLLEAMASGTPVVCSALPELIDTGGDAVVPVEALTPHGLATALRQLLADETRLTRLSRAGRRRAYGFSWSAVAESVEDVYRQVITGRP